MKGIIIKQPYANSIIDGTKEIEYRHYRLPKAYLEKPIYLLSQKKILGVIQFTLKISDHPKFIIYQYTITVIEKFIQPLNYDHPNGAQLYVKEVKVRN